MKKLCILFILILTIIPFNGKSEINTGYRAFVDLGYSIDINGGSGCIDLTTTHGFQISPYIFTGIGTGINYYHKASAIKVPIFACIRTDIDFFNSSNMPFADLKIGYSLGNGNGFMMLPSIGFRFDIFEKIGTNVGIGYSMLRIDDCTYGGIQINVGIDF